MKTLLQSITLSVILLSLSFSVSAQSQRDVVYLKNGAVIKGIILEMIPDSTLKIETADGSIFVYKLEEVIKIAKEDVPKPLSVNVDRAQIKDNKYEALQPSGCFILARVAANERITEDEVTDIAGGIIAGVHLNKYLSLGVGAEATRYTFNDIEDNVNFYIPMYPVFMDVRFYVPKTRVHPMFSLQYGYAFIDHSKLPHQSNINRPKPKDKGVYVAIGGGIRALITKTFSIFVDGAVSLQSIDGYSSYYSYYYRKSNGGSISGDNNRIVPTIRLNVGLCLSIGSKK